MDRLQERQQRKPSKCLDSAYILRTPEQVRNDRGADDEAKKGRE